MLQARARCAACRQGWARPFEPCQYIPGIYCIERTTVQRHRQGGAGRERGDTHRSERGPGPSNTTLRHRPPHRPEPRPGHTRIGPGTKRSGQHGPETTQGAGTHTGDWNKKKRFGYCKRNNQLLARSVDLLSKSAARKKFDPFT